jgi:hypothetical protein
MNVLSNNSKRDWFVILEDKNHTLITETNLLQVTMQQF